MAIPGSNIRLLRQQLGLSQQGLADLVGMNKGNLSRLEHGEVGYSREIIDKIARALNVSVGVLFAETIAVEAAALRMRRAPVLTFEQLIQWKGPESIDFDEDQEFLHGDLRLWSRWVFALRIDDLANAPRFEIGDELIFDANKTPRMGSMVAAQTGANEVIVGRFRPLPNSDKNNPLFEVMPYDSLYGGGSKVTDKGLQLRGTLVEFRRQTD